MSSLLVSIPIGPAADELMAALAKAGHTSPVVQEERLDGVAELLQIALPVVTPAVAFVLGRYFAHKTAVAMTQQSAFQIRSADGKVICAQGQAADRLLDHLRQESAERPGQD